VVESELAVPIDSAVEVSRTGILDSHPCGYQLMRLVRIARVSSAWAHTSIRRGNCSWLPMEACRTSRPLIPRRLLLVVVHYYYVCFGVSASFTKLSDFRFRNRGASRCSLWQTSWQLAQCINRCVEKSQPSTQRRGSKKNSSAIL
jgi:hypothetical protein